LFPVVNFLKCAWLRLTAFNKEIDDDDDENMLLQKSCFQLLL